MRAFFPGRWGISAGMGTRSWVAVAVVVLGFANAANADPKADIQAKSKEAMDSYDLMDYEEEP